MTQMPPLASRHMGLLALLLILLVGGFLLGIGLGPDALPFAPEAQFSDAVTSHWPAALFLRRSVLEEGAWPLWRPLLMSGQPFAANPLNKVWYPPQWLALLLPPILHLNALTGLHLVIGGLGMAAWARAGGMRPEAAALAALGYAFAPRLVGSVGGGHLDLVYAAAWFPWLLWAVNRACAGAPPRRVAAQIGGFAALCLLADVRLGAYAWATAAAYALWLLAQTPRARHLAPRTILAAGLLALGLSAPVWSALLLLGGDLSRGDLTLADAAAGSLTPGGWLGLLIGNHGGGWESMVYVGVSTLVLAGIALLRAPRRLALWGGLLLLVAAYAMGEHFLLWPALNRLLPPLRWWRVPGRVWLVAALILPYLAGWGAHLLAEASRLGHRGRLGTAALLGGGVVLVAAGAVVLRPVIGGGPVLGLLALPLTALVILLGQKLPPRVLVIALAAILLADLLWIDRTLVEGRSRAAWLDPYAPLAALLAEDGATRVYSPSYSLPQQAAAYWDIPQFGGVDPFQLRTYTGAFAAASGIPAAGYSITLPPYSVNDPGPADSERDRLARANRDALPDAALLGEWLVSHVVAAFPLEVEGLELVREMVIEDAPVYVYRNTLAPAVALDWDGPNRVTITAEESLTGRLYAIAGGRWQDAAQPDDAENTQPGLPGEVDSTESVWRYAYDPPEVWLALAALVIFSSAAWIVVPRR